MENNSEKPQLLLEHIKKAVSLRIELSRITELHFCTFDPEVWIENMSLSVDSANDVTLSDVEDFRS